jgi:hypothetical protein
MAGIRLRNGFRALRQAVAGKHIGKRSRILPAYIQAEFLCQSMVQIP